VSEAATPSLPPCGGGQEGAAPNGAELRRFIHRKRGTTYTEIGRGLLQSDQPLEDMAVVVLYRSEKDGSLWVRPPHEFDDGRFREVPPSADPVQLPSRPSGPIESPLFYFGDRVSKIGGDYRFDGEIRGVVTKLSGALRYVVEDDRGVLHVFSAKQLRRRDADDEPTVVGDHTVPGWVADFIDRRVIVENELRQAAAGQRPPPDAAECRTLADRLSIPSQYLPVSPYPPLAARPEPTEWR